MCEVVSGGVERSSVAAASLGAAAAAAVVVAAAAGQAPSQAGVDAASAGGATDRG